MELNNIYIWLSVVLAFTIIATASKQLAQLFSKLKLPLITGFIVVGILAGPYVLKMLPKDLGNLSFINDISLGFIAFAAGAEMYLKDIKARSKSIFIMTNIQVLITFVGTVIILYLFIDVIPFAQSFSQKTILSFILLSATIFIAPSLATTISIISEQRANGPFSKTAIGVSVFKDILLISIFAVVFGISEVMLEGKTMHWYEAFIVIVELILSIGIGLIYGVVYKYVFNLKKSSILEIILFLLAGWSTFLLAKGVNFLSAEYLSFPIHLEAIMIGITACFYIVNYSSHRLSIEKLVEKISPYVYVTFFTLVGASLSLDLLVKYWFIAILFFILRIVLTFLSSFIGSLISKDSLKEAMLSWTPHIAQAGVSLGLITIVAESFPQFGHEFAAIMVSVIVINQFIGPPLMKFAINRIGESHVKSTNYGADYQRDIVVIGIGAKAIMLAKTMITQQYKVKIISEQADIDKSECETLDIQEYNELNLINLKNAGVKEADSVVIFRKESRAYELSEMIYENFGTPNIIVYLNKSDKIEDFKKLGVIVVEPTSAIISLLEHFVRSPQATSIILGMQKTQITEDIEILNKDLQGEALRNIKFPLGILVISITRNNHTVFPHGYTRLKNNDIVTVVGSREQIDKVRTKLQY